MFGSSWDSGPDKASRACCETARGLRADARIVVPGGSRARREGRATVPTTTAPPRESLVEAVATIEAAGDVFYELLGADDAIAEHFATIARRLRVELLDGPTEDEWTEDHPLVVEIMARSSEIEADALEARFSGAYDRIPTLRARAADYREQGTVDLNFHTGERMDP